MKPTVEGVKKKAKGAPSPPPPARAWETSSKVLPPGVLGSKVSEFDEVSSRFTQVVAVQDQDPFTLKPLILNSGAYEGYNVFLVVKNVTFHSFPAELRNKILLAVLETGMRFQIRALGTVRRLDPTTVALARASRQIHADVIPIIYGSNTFDFGTLEHLHAFSKRIGAARAHLRHISVLHDTGLIESPRTRNLFAMLQQMTNLQSLTLNHESLYLHALPTHGKMRIEDFVCQLKPFLHAWHQANGGSTSVLSLVRLAKRDFCSRCGNKIEAEAVICSYGCRLTQVQKTELKHLQRVSEKLKAMVAAEMGLED